MERTWERTWRFRGDKSWIERKPLPISSIVGRGSRDFLYRDFSHNFNPIEAANNVSQHRATTFFICSSSIEERLSSAISGSSDFVVAVNSLDYIPSRAQMALTLMIITNGLLHRRLHRKFRSIILQSRRRRWLKDVFSGIGSTRGGRGSKCRVSVRENISWR